MRNKIKSTVRHIRTVIWQTPQTNAPLWKRLPIEAVKRCILAVRLFTAKRVMSEASALTYSTLLAIVPILAVVFAIARGFGYNKYIEMWFREALQSQPQAAEAIVDFVNRYLVHTTGGIFLIVGLAFMLYTVLILVSNIEMAFNGIWQVKKKRSIYRTFTDYMAMLFLLPFVLVLTSGLSLFMATVAKSMPNILILGSTMRFFIALSPYALMSLMFVGMYVFVPNTHVKVSNAIVPGILAGVAMQGLQFFYIHSQIWVSRYNAIYGSFAALPLFMLWVQISWTICLFGASLCYMNQNQEYYDYDMNTDDISHSYRMQMCALIMSRICKRFDEGKRPYTALELRDETEIPIHIVNDLLYDLMTVNLLVEISNDEKGAASRFMPAESIDRMSVGCMMDRLESHGQWRLSLPLGKYYNDKWAQVLQARSKYLSDLREVLLKDL